MDVKLLTVEELAKEWRVPKSWIYSRTRERGPKRIPLIRVGKYIRFVESEVMEWIIKRTENRL